MKIRFALLVIFLAFTCYSTQAGDFDSGWKCGWDAGWKQIKGQYAYPPYPPYPPFPRYGQDDSWRGGFAAGVLAGAAAAQGY